MKIKAGKFVAEVELQIHLENYQFQTIMLRPCKINLLT